jgi:hypothetical protein
MRDRLQAKVVTEDLKLPFPWYFTCVNASKIPGKGQSQANCSHERLTA